MNSEAESEIGIRPSISRAAILGIRHQYCTHCNAQSEDFGKVLAGKNTDNDTQSGTYQHRLAKYAEAFLYLIHVNVNLVDTPEFFQ